jgi:hypothetical protein
VVVRALDLHTDHTFSTLLRRVWYLLAAMLLVNILSVYFSTRCATWLQPLLPWYMYE